MRAFLRRLRARVKYWDHDRDVAREIEQHRAMAEADAIAGGESRYEARWKAARALGNTTIAREDVRAMWIPRYLQQLGQDARYALRGMRRAPGFTLAALTMLSVGIGLPVGGFVFINGLFFRGWPVPENSRVFIVSPVFPPSAGRVDDGTSLGAYRQLEANARTADYAAYRSNFVRISVTETDRPGGNVPTGYYVSDNFFRVLRLPMHMGTAPLPNDGTEEPTVVISYWAWQTIFGGDPNIVGHTAWLDGHPARVAGVTAKDFEGLGRAVGVYAPLSATRTLRTRGSIQAAVADEHACCMSVVGRMHDGQSLTAIRAELEGLVGRYRASIGKPALTLQVSDTSSGAAVLGRGNVAATLTMGLAAVMAVLILTCANVGNLYLARSLRRQHEITTRLALGAGRSRLVRQLLAEGLVLAAVAGALAFLIASAVPSFIPPDTMPPGSLEVDWRVGAATVSLVLFVCLFVSLAPALRTTRVTWYGGAAMATARTGGLRGGLLSLQLAAATMLIVCAALLTRGIQFGMTSSADFALQTTTGAKLQWPSGAAPSGEKVAAFRANLTSAMRSSRVPMGMATNLPVSEHAGISTAVVDPATALEYRARLFPMSSTAAPVLGLSLVEGRWASDDPAAQEAVINRMLAAQIWNGGPASGHSLKLAFNKTSYTITGVVDDTHILSLATINPTIHIPPLADTPYVLTAKTAEGEGAVRAMVASIEPTVTVTFVPLTEAVRATMGEAISFAAGAGALGAAALALAMVGVYSVFSYLVEERRREIGIRVALGARRPDIRRAVFHATRWAIGGGVLIGLALAMSAGFVMRAFLFGMSPLDPWSYGAVGAVLALTALAATYVPIRRALRTDPAITLKAD
jgi:predicted permease